MRVCRHVCLLGGNHENINKNIQILKMLRKYSQFFFIIFQFLFLLLWCGNSHV